MAALFSVVFVSLLPLETMSSQESSQPSDRVRGHSPVTMDVCFPITV